MRLTNLKRPGYYVPLGLVFVLAVTCAVVFHPAFQKKMLLDYVAPRVDALEIGSVHLTPWSLDFDRISVGYRGGRFQAGQGSIRFCPSSLLLLNLNIKRIALKNVRIDLRTFQPPDTPPQEPAGPFPGVLASLEHGVSFTLHDVDANAEVLLPGRQSLRARLSGGGIEPKTSGTLVLAVRFDTGREDDHIDLDGTVTFNQQTRGRFDALRSEAAIQAVMAALPEPERADVTLSVTPAPIQQGAQSAAAGGGERRRYTPESLQLAVRQNDSEGNSRTALALQGTYDGNDGRFEGGYRGTANERLVQPYAGAKRIPPTEEALNGKLNFNLADLTGDMTVVSDLVVRDLRQTQANARLPERLRLKNNFRLALLPGRQLRVETLDSDLTDDAGHTPLTAKLPAELHVPLEHISTFLQQENTLLEFELPDVPLIWFDVFLPGQTITAGTLTGAFAITTDAQSAILLKPLKPLRVSGLGFERADGSRVENLNLSALPGVTYSGAALRVSVDKLVIDAGKEPLATATLAATLPLSKDRSGALDAQGDADLDMHALTDVLAGEPTSDQTLPRHLSLALQTRIRQAPGRLLIDRLDANVDKDRRTRLLTLQLQQPLILEDTANGGKIANASGTLATLAVSNVRLGWFSAFVPGTTLQGVLHRADVVLTAEAPGVADLTAAGPFRIDGISVARKDGPVLEKLGVSLRPAIRLTPDGTTLTYKDLRVTGGKARLVAGNGQVRLPGTAERPLLADGHLEVDLQALSRQPLIARSLPASITDPVRLEADYRLAQGEDRIDISRLAARLFYSDAQPRVSLQADSRIRIRTRLGRQSELGRARGKVTLTLADLTPEPFAKILAAHGLAFTRIAGKAVLTSDGRSMKVATLEPLALTGLAVKTKEAALLEPFTLTADVATTLDGDSLHAGVNRLSLAFDRDKGAHALDGNLDVVLKGSGDAVRIESARTDLTLSLPAMLDQPALLPGHTLTAGELNAAMTLNPDGDINATARIHDLRGAEELPLQSLQMQVDGHLDPDGGFAVTAPITTAGKSGESRIGIKATRSVKDGGDNAVALAVDSPVFYLNDILNTLDAIGGKRPAQTAADSAGAKGDQQPANEQAAVLDDRPDTRAFWDGSGYSARIAFDLGHLFYTDYLDIQNIKARAQLAPDRLTLSGFEAHFHDSPVTADGALNFTGGESPYDLKLQADVKHFDLARFFRELEPGSKPPAEGLFDVTIDAFGRSANMAQYRNNLYFDAHLQSGKGVFRLLDPDSALVSGSTGLAGGFGEVVSYLPTGLFGLAAVSRLVDYIKEIEYDKIDIHLVRDASRDVQIKEYVVQSPEVLLTAHGGVEYREGTDILQSPLALDAQLAMRAKGAAILYELNLLESKQDSWGYWKGPSVHFRGTPAKPESNLEDIISKAGRSMMLGGVTRPISGLIGNVKHRWIGDDEKPLEYSTGDDK